MGQRWPGHAVLQSPVAALDDFVSSRWRHYDPSLLGDGAVEGERFVHAHVTVLGPFDELPPLAAVDSLVAELVAFEASAESVEVFDNGVVHAPALPRRAFEAWTAAARRHFASVEPYRGEFEVAPHVTLDALGPGVDAHWVRSRVELPARWWADRLDLVWYEQGATRLVRRWRLQHSCQ